MRIYSNEEIANAWIFMHMHGEESKEYKDNFFSYEILESLIERDCERAWAIINIIINLSRDDKIIANLAAGPVEKLLVLHGPVIIKRIEEKAESDKTFRRMLGAIWQGGMADDVWARVKSVSETSW